MHTGSVASTGGSHYAYTPSERSSAPAERKAPAPKAASGPGRGGKVDTSA